MTFVIPFVDACSSLMVVHVFATMIVVLMAIGNCYRLFFFVLFGLIDATFTHTWPVILQVMTPTIHLILALGNLCLSRQRNKFNYEAHAHSHR